MIVANNLYKSFNEKLILNNVSITLEQQKTNLIIGVSGSGKTVLLKSLVGLHSVDSGKIYYDNREYTSMKFKEKKNLRTEIGMLFQGSALFDSMTVEQNVGFPLQMFSNKSEEEIRDRVNFCLNRVNLENTNHLFPSEISGGMQKRVAIARAIVLSPKYLFCDEPNSGLDPKTAIVIDNLIKELTYEYNMVTVINTHDLNSILGFGDNICFLHKGEIGWTGSSAEILHTDNEHLNEFIYASEIVKRLK